ncbi:hypothetical protein [Gorillibacterium timonense]|uniref:hypothetical protein n=1 Tax=Gorillibacterium timonense TaxID=1689269 RepID=UPI0011DE5186|nr:hypothetical protein [Gorillibacterium timonense]
MRSFKEAYTFMAQKSPLEIFYEVLPYVLEAESRGKRFGDDKIAMLTAAFGGKFDKQVLNDPPIRDLLEISDWGWNNPGTSSIRWGEKYAKSQAEQLHYNAICNLIGSKSDQVYEYLVENARTGFAYRPGCQFDMNSF